jgi:acyl carrier protein
VSQVQNVVEKALLEVRGIAVGSLDLESTLKDSGVDSLDLVEVGMIVEEAFDILIEPEAFEGCTTYGDVLSVFQRLVDK